MKPKAASSKRLHTVFAQYVCVSVLLCACVCAAIEECEFSCLVGY